MRIWFLLCFLVSSLSAQEDFFRWMGKETPHWVHVSKQEDVAFLEKCAALFEKNKNFRFTEKGPYKIPNTIHFIWVGPRPFPPQSVQNIRTWLAFHPDWKVKFWTDRDRPPPCIDMETCRVETFPFLFLRDCYEESENWGEKSDVLRFEILYQEGGVYVDHDANCLQSFDGLHRGYDFYCGLESPHPPFAGRNITLGNGLIGSRPFHPIVGRVMEGIQQKWMYLKDKYKGRDGFSRTQLVMERTYMQLTDSLFQRICEDGNIDIVFPAAFFFAKKGISPIYSRHFFANAWADESEKDQEFAKTTKKTLGKLIHRNKAILLIGRGALILNLAIFLGIFLYFLRKRRRSSL